MDRIEGIGNKLGQADRIADRPGDALRSRGRSSYKE